MSAPEEPLPVALLTYLDDGQVEEVGPGEWYRCWLPDEPGETLMGYDDAEHFATLVAVEGLARYIRAADVARNLATGEPIPVREISANEHRGFRLIVLQGNAGVGVRNRPADYSFAYPVPGQR